MVELAAYTSCRPDLPPAGRVPTFPIRCGRLTALAVTALASHGSWPPAGSNLTRLRYDATTRAMRAARRPGHGRAGSCLTPVHDAKDGGAMERRSRAARPSAPWPVCPGCPGARQGCCPAAHTGPTIGGYARNRGSPRQRPRPAPRRCLRASQLLDGDVGTDLAVRLSGRTAAVGCAEGIIPLG